MAWLLLSFGALATPLVVVAQAPGTPAPAPLGLGDVLQATLTRHPALDGARARVRAAVGARSAAGVLGNPVFTYSLENARLPGGSDPNMPREAMTTITLPLEPFYQRGARVRQAGAALRAAEADAATDRQRLALDAAHAYYRLALAQEQAAAARDLLRWLDSLVAYNQARAREGAAAEADLIRARLERDRAGAQLTNEEVAQAQAQAELAAFVADSASATGVRLVAVARSLAVATDSGPLGPPPDADSLPVASPLAARPEMRVARERLAAAEAGIDVEQRLLLRQLGATLGTKQSGGTTSLVVGASVPLPLFDRNRGEVARARADRDARAADLAMQSRAVSAEVAAAETVVHLLTARVAALGSARVADTAGYLARADEARRITLGAYREGAVPLIQVLDAARAWGEARITFYRTLYAQHESVLALVAARGLDLFTHVPVGTTPGAPSPEGLR